MLPPSCHFFLPDSILMQVAHEIEVCRRVIVLSDGCRGDNLIRLYGEMHCT